MAQSQIPAFGQNRFSIALVESLKNIVGTGVYAGFKAVVVAATFNIEIKNLGVVGRAKTKTGVVIEDNDTSGALDTLAVVPTPTPSNSRYGVALMSYTHEVGAVATYSVIYGAETAGTPVKPTIPSDAIELASWILAQSASSMDDATSFANVVEAKVASNPLAPGDTTNLSEVVLTGATGGSADEWSRADHEHDHGDLAVTPTGSPHDANQVALAAGTPGDWTTPPTSSQEGFDELADRLTTAVSPSDVDTPAAPGTSKEAARADHVHDHADMSGAAVTHHDSGQVENEQANSAAWTVADGSGVKAHLDELVALAYFADMSGLIVRFYSNDFSELTQGFSTTLFDVPVGLAGTGGLPTKVLRVRTSASLFANKSTVGPVAGGRDSASAFAVDTWVRLFVIGDTTGVNSPALIVSINAVSSGPTLPAGYDVYRVIATCRNDSSGNYLSCFKTGRETTYESHQLVTSSVPPSGSMGYVALGPVAPTEHLWQPKVRMTARSVQNGTVASELWGGHADLGTPAAMVGHLLAVTGSSGSASEFRTDSFTLPAKAGGIDNIVMGRNNAVYGAAGFDLYVNGWVDKL